MLFQYSTGTLTAVAHKPPEHVILPDLVPLCLRGQKVKGQGHKGQKVIFHILAIRRGSAYPLSALI